MQVLEDGGNAVDAAIAISYTLGVVQPFASGIGGGGCMLIYNPNTDSYSFINYYSSAPVSSQTKRSSIGVPGFVKGMEYASEKYGTKDISELIQPAIDYAENGFKVYTELNTKTSQHSESLNNTNFVVNGAAIPEGKILSQPELAKTLKQIQVEGSESFYTGSIAKTITDNTYLTNRDMESYVVDEQEPVCGKFYGYDIISSPAPFGGITLIQMLEMFELLDIKNPNENIENYLDILNSIGNIASSDRVKNIADTNFYTVDSEKLVSIEYIKTLLKNQNIEYEDDQEGENTTAFSVIDKDGMVVSCTNTIGCAWGSKTCVNGIIFNASLNNFADSSTNINAYKAGMKPRTYISSTIVKKDDYIMGIGTPGGNKIVKILAQVLLDSIKFDTDIQTAINRNRALFISNNVLALENNSQRENFVDIENSKYILSYNNNNEYFGAVQAVGYSKKLGIFGATDSRRTGSVKIK